MLCSCWWAAAGRAPAERPPPRTGARARHHRSPRAGPASPVARCHPGPAATPALPPPPAATHRGPSSQTPSPDKQSVPASTTEHAWHSPPTRASPAQPSVSTAPPIPPPTRTPTPVLVSTAQPSTHLWYVPLIYHQSGY